MLSNVYKCKVLDAIYFDASFFVNHFGTCMHIVCILSTDKNYCDKMFYHRRDLGAEER